MILPVNVLSLGAGVQSSTVALKAAQKEFEPLPLAGIFSDTKAEPRSVYLHLAWLCGVEVKLDEQGRSYVEPGCYQAGMLPFPVYIVSYGDLEKDTLTERTRKDGQGTWVPSGIPHYSINSDGSKGHGPRQCTHDFKLLPILTKERELVGRENFTLWRRKHKPALKALTQWEKDMKVWKRLKKAGEEAGPAPVRPAAAWQECQSDPLCITWIGISSDEASRMKESRHSWIVHRYPLCDTDTSRADCLAWMQAKGYPKPPRSACVFCPYHSDAEWRRLRDEEPEEFARAVRFDVAYRQAKIRTVIHKGFVPYLHDSRKPLAEVDFSTEKEKGQLPLFNNECEGMCGV